MTKKNLFPILSLFLTGPIAYLFTFRWMAERWFAADSYYSHGPLVPLVSGFFLWANRKRLLEIHRHVMADGNTSFLQGMFVLGAGIIFLLLGTFWEVGFLAGFSLLPLLAGTVLFLWGREMLKETLFPLLFLAFMIPVPMVLIAGVSYQLKMLASQGALVMLKSVGIPALRGGSFLYTRHATLLVGDVCSGLRSLISLLAMGAVFAHWLRGPLWKKAVMLLSAVPVAVAANAFRVFLLCLVAEIYGENWVRGFFHDFSGFLLFGAAFGLLAGVMALLQTRGGSDSHE